ncbi:hypothetical protein D6C85_07935 [Aureobasidium pullulans]|uniref:Uncharacterized protein n=1 Tax=Aureobasidium pullulans TaxID=5580 RepID=A0A4S9WP29_AURPU|nr:hypothetical protein D6D24_09127 [Aureobasidium pullulans]THZ67064.1 hypothetical protein D6C85_07935 [Aureobasidium pullulans]THZ94916.1 hypothetical protein D6C82_07999 [Aureobasidium pullulans]
MTTEGRNMNGATETAVEDEHLACTALPPAPKHKHRSLSAGLLQRFNFLSRPAPVELSTSAPAAVGLPMQAEDDSSHLSRPQKARKRKGSLRKTALLGPGRVKQDPPATEIFRVAQDAQSDDAIRSIDDALHDALAAEDLHQPRRLSLVSEHSPNSSPPSIPPPPVHPDLGSPIISPTSQSYASTTDDDDLSMAATVTRPASYFDPRPVLDVVRRRSSQKHAPSPLSAVPVLAHKADDAYDYAETERWGWVVLVVTWVVFAVGMGSCLGVWSWAWDVGQTPYAPPELEDDPTLPIVGYYPALIILTSVMAWVWVVVAWVGMKYFKHAKIQGDD